MTAPLPLDEHDVHLITVPVPIEVRLLVDITAAVSQVAKRHGLQPPVLLFDGTNRVVARRAGAPERVS